jgi:Dyp-type peroxidase family
VAKSKYFDGVKSAQASQSDDNKAMLAPFDFTVLGEKGAFRQWIGRMTTAMIPPVYAFSRRFKPLLPLAGLLHVTREAQVRDILMRPQDFITPFGPEMAELGEGATFLLGLEGEEHDRMHAILRQVIRREDAEHIGIMSRQFTDALLDNSAGQIDVVGDLLKRVPAEICLRYFGLHCDDVDAFGDWTMALSSFLFGDPYGKPEVRQLAMNAKRRLTIVIDDAIMRSQRLVRTGAIHAGNADTLVARLVVVQQNATVSDGEIRAILMGLATGFIPTNTLAASNMLQELLKRPDAMALARQAAHHEDRAAMHKIVLEAGRLNPALAPGQWRYCLRDTELMIDGKAHPIKAGTTLLVSTMSALRDPRAWEKPMEFRLDRADPDLVFGVGPHWCLGKYLALEQISGLFEGLLRREDLRCAKGEAGRLARVGPFPRRMMMHYASPSSQQSMFLVIAKVQSGASKYAVDKDIAKLGHPAGTAIKASLDATGIVHFASLATIMADEGLFISFELSIDGAIDAGLDAIAAHSDDMLRPIFVHAGLHDDESVAQFLKRHVVQLHGKPWGANGLNYNGLAEFPVQMVERQARFADFAGRVLRDYVATETVRGSHPSLAMAHLRRILRGDAELAAEATVAQAALIAEAQRENFDALHLTTDAARLNLTRFRPIPYLQAAFNFLKSRDGLVLTLPLSLVFAIFVWGLWPKAAGPFSWQILATAAKAMLATILVAGTVFGMFLFKLRRAETTEVPATDQAALDKMHAILQQENPPGFAHNHILAVGTLKQGWFRAYTHALALWGIKMAIVHAYRPGLVINMGTIHYARWFRIPGTRKAAFYSNFDGSWESYLEDFITRAAPGQSAAWSNWEGYPRTRFLIRQGATDGDAFKRFTRTVQQLVPFWYSRFPSMTTDQIRTNAMIHSGAGLARTATECEEWLRCFGSMPRVDNRIESDEVQALVFRGMKRLPYSVALAVQLPPAGEAVGEWLCWVRGRPMQAGGVGGAAQIAALVDDGVLLPVPRPEGRPTEYALAHALTIAFGDRPLTGDDGTMGSATGEASASVNRDAKAATSHAVFLALSAAGIAKFAAPNAMQDSLLESFPFAFRMGMAARGDRILGDRGRDAPAGWRWQDDGRQGTATEAMVMLYASTPDQLARATEIHRALLENHGGAVLSQVDCAPAWADPEKSDFEHFGYRDGISQPVMRGTSRSVRGVPERDVVEPGEFILGYKNGQGFYPPSPVLSPESDVRGALPIAVEGTLSRFPDFGDKSLTMGPRDLGRNGSFLVIRELRQEVDAFEAFVDDAAERLNSGGLSDLYRLVGQSPDREWVKAKLMGRWPNGRPLIGCPVNIGTRNMSAETDNDFSYGEDDPQGLACPFGSHIRRTNPRDSKQPSDEWEQVISNRHRLLRRGRTYTRPDGEKGLLFASLCTDIERQFEFVQQFWSNAPAFHGLENEPDPFVGADPINPKDGTPLDRVFTIPTPAGPLRLDGLKSFVQTKGGGYFFLPSRSALGWLADTALYMPQSANKDAPHEPV